MFSLAFLHLSQNIEVRKEDCKQIQYLLHKAQPPIYLSDTNMAE